MGGDVEDVGGQAVGHLLAEVFHARGLEDPGGGGLQVIQEHAADRLRLVQHLPVVGGVQSEALDELGLEEVEGGAVLALRVFHGIDDLIPLGVGAAHAGDKVAEQPQGRRLLGISAVFQPPLGKLDELGAVRVGDAVQGHIQNSVQQGEGLVGLHGLGRIV